MTKQKQWRPLEIQYVWGPISFAPLLTPMMYVLKFFVGPSSVFLTPTSVTPLHEGRITDFFSYALLEITKKSQKSQKNYRNHTISSNQGISYTFSGGDLPLATAQDLLWIKEGRLFLLDSQKATALVNLQEMVRNIA